MIEIISMAELVTFFGNIPGIKPADLHTFVATLSHHQFGGSYPDRTNESSDETTTASNRAVLAQTGIPDCSPIVLCDSIQERAKKILAACQRHNAESGSGQYLVVDQNPHALAEAMKSTLSPDIRPAGKDLLKAITIIKLGPVESFDLTDRTTGIRVAALSSSLPPYPMHPTPAS